MTVAVIKNFLTEPVEVGLYRKPRRQQSSLSLSQLEYLPRHSFLNEPIKNIPEAKKERKHNKEIQFIF